MKLQNLIPTTAILSLLIAAAFKNDEAGLQASSFWADLAIGPEAAFIKQNSLIFAGTSGACALNLVRWLPSNASSYFVAAAFIFCSILSATSAIANGMDAEIDKTLVAIAGFFIVFFTILSTATHLGARAGFFALLNAQCIAGGVVIMVNAYGWAMGYGFVPDNSRFFGTALHPNFTGVQLAIFISFFVIRLFLSNMRVLRAILFALLLVGWALLIETGSRTGIIMATLSVIFAVWIRLGGTAASCLILLIFAALSTAILGAATDLGLGFDQFERGDTQDTRTEVWRVMLQYVERSPVFGYGTIVGDSENSFLKSCVAYGIPYACVFHGTVGISILIGVLRSSFQGLYANIAPVGVPLLAGSLVEGYLADAFSLSAITAYSLVSIVVAGSPAVTAPRQSKVG